MKEEAEQVAEILEDVNAQIAKSKRTREAIDAGNDNFFVEDTAKRAEQRVRGEKETGMF
jgi:hypothetical protein